MVDLSLSRERGYRDARLTAAMKAHRAALRGDGDTARTLAAVEERLRYIDRCLRSWDDHHSRLAGLALDAGKHERAALNASLIWDDDARRAILAQVRMEGAGDDAAARIAANLEAGRLVEEEVMG